MAVGPVRHTTGPIVEEGNGVPDPASELERIREGEPTSQVITYGLAARWFPLS